MLRMLLTFSHIISGASYIRCIHRIRMEGVRSLHVVCIIEGEDIRFHFWTTCGLHTSLGARGRSRNPISLVSMPQISSFFSVHIKWNVPTYASNILLDYSRNHHKSVTRHPIREKRRPNDHRVLLCMIWYGLQTQKWHISLIEGNDRNTLRT